MPTRRTAVAGRFYPADPKELGSEITRYFQQAGAQAGKAERGRDGGDSLWTLDRPLLTMLPHAGHFFCGQIIAATLSGITLPPRLIILAPSHTGRGHPLGFWPDGQWDTPLGAVPVDAELGQELAALPGGYAPDLQPHLQEHDIEVLLPFLLAVQPKLSILPIVIGRPEGLPEAAHALATLLGRHAGNVSVIISSDMNHYANEPETRRRDNLALEALLALEPQRLAAVVHEHKISMCGILPALLGLLAANELGVAHSRLMAYSTSAAASGDNSRVVGYAGVRIW